MSSSTVEISRKEYEGMKETIEVLQDSESVKAIEKGLKELENGETSNWEKTKEDLNI